MKTSVILKMRNVARYAVLALFVSLFSSSFGQYPSTVTIGSRTLSKSGSGSSTKYYYSPPGCGDSYELINVSGYWRLRIYDYINWGSGYCFYARTDNYSSTISHSNAPCGSYAGSYVVTGCCSVNAWGDNKNNPSCFGEQTGDLRVNWSGGTKGAVDISWTGPTSSGTPTRIYNNSGSTTFSNKFKAGTYTITVAESGNTSCYKSFQVTFADPDQLTLTGHVDRNVSCNGGSNAQVRMTRTGGTNGTPTYYWSWTGPSTSGLHRNYIDHIFYDGQAGEYALRVTDHNGCTANATVTVTQPSALGCQISSSSNVTCNGSSDGSATVTASGGTTNYSYAWSSGGNAASETGLDAGVHTVTVTDANQCKTYCSVTITQPEPFNVNVMVTDHVICNGGNDGAITVNCTGCSAPSYIWDGPGSYTSTDQNISGLKGGKYNITVTDLCGTYSTEVTVNQPKRLKVDCTSTDATCFGDSDGSATITASEGTGPYAYTWPGGQSTATVTGLTAGTYEVTVTDDCHTKTCIATVGEPDKFIAYTRVSRFGNYNISCENASNGTIEVSTIGGNAGQLSYAWNPSSYSGDYLTGLDVGYYYVTVTDSKGCTGNIGPIVMTAPTGTMTLGTPTSTDVSCNGGNDGSACISATGGSGSYGYTWSNGGNTSCINGLTAGTYSVTVTDNGGCAQTASVSVGEPAVLGLSAYTYDAECYNGNQGEIDLTVSGGTSKYSFNWAGQDFNGRFYSYAKEDWSNRKAGTYCVTVTDANGCEASDCYDIDQPTKLTTSAIITKVSCNGGSDGAVDLSVTGGRPPYTYDWDNSATTQDLSSLVAGKYICTVEDKNGCISKRTANVSQPNILNLSATVVQPTCGSSDGSITLSASGGTGAKSYAWTGTSAPGSKATKLASGTYSVTATDTKGCSANLSETLNGCIPKAMDSYSLIELLVYPNPSTGEVTLSIENGFRGDKLRVTDLQGKLLLEQELWGTIEIIDLSTHAEGTYFVFVEMDGVILQKRIVIAR